MPAVVKAPKRVAQAKLKKTKCIHRTVSHCLLLLNRDACLHKKLPHPHSLHSVSGACKAFLCCVAAEQKQFQVCTGLIE